MYEGSFLALKISGERNALLVARKLVRGLPKGKHDI